MKSILERGRETWALTIYVPNKLRWRLLFGSPSRSIDLCVETQGARATRLHFAQGSIWGVSRRWLNAYGTTRHDVLAIRAPTPGAEISVIDGVKPGGIVVLHATGANAERALRLFELAEELGIDLANEEELLRDLDVRLNGRVFPERFIRRFARSEGA